MSVENTFTCTVHLHPRQFLQWSGRCRAVVNRVWTISKSLFSFDHGAAELHALSFWTWNPWGYQVAVVKSLFPDIGWESVVRLISINGASVQPVREQKSRSRTGNGHDQTTLTFRLSLSAGQIWRNLKQFYRFKEKKNFLKAWNKTGCESKT